MAPEQLAKIDPARAGARLRGDAERYSSLAAAEGATVARVVPAAAIPFDDRVVMKCAVPKCFGYGTCGNCPPYAPPVERMRAIAAQYELAVVVGLDVEPAVLVRDRATILERVAAYKSVFSIVAAIESAAFYDGHYLSLGLAAGSCKSTFCHDLDCAVLAGQKCRHNLVARPSMEAVGIDCYRLAADLGWEMYPVGSSVSAASLPTGVLLGMVLVG